MQLVHPCITTSPFGLVTLVEFDVQIYDDAFSLRVELFRSLKEPGLFRARLWRDEHFRIQSEFPFDQRSRRPADEPSSELILVNWETNLLRTKPMFKAKNVDEALELVLMDIGKFLEHASGKRAQKRRLRSGSESKARRAGKRREGWHR